jgi:hypothetical protein
MKTFNAFRAWFAGRFPRVAYYYSSPQVWTWALIWYVGALFRALAERRIIPHPLWLPATIVAIGAGLVIALEAWHAAVCPCVTEPELFDEAPADDLAGGE